MAEFIAKQFPDELASRVPPRRKAWTSEINRMDIFDEVALAVVFRMNKTKRTALSSIIEKYERTLFADYFPFLAFKVTNWKQFSILNK